MLLKFIFIMKQKFCRQYIKKNQCHLFLTKPLSPIPSPLINVSLPYFQIFCFCCIWIRCGSVIHRHTRLRPSCINPISPSPQYLNTPKPPQNKIKGTILILTKAYWTKIALNFFKKIIHKTSQKITCKIAQALLKNYQNNHP